MMRTVDGRVFARPFTEKGVIVSTTPSGIRFVGNYDHLVKTEALADGADDIKAGDTIYVTGTSVKQQWAKVAYDLGDGKVGVLIPREAIVLIERLYPVSLPPVVPHADE